MPGTLSEGRFARLPNAWIYDNGLSRFRTTATHRGVSGAALKLLLAILTKAENAAAARAGPNQGSASLTYGELEELTDLARSSIAAGLKRLQNLEIVRVVHEGRGRRNRYLVRDYGRDDKYGRMSLARLYGGPNSHRMAFLHQLSTRNEADVNAMKLYLLFCAVYDRSRKGAMISYVSIAEMTGIGQGKIRRALSVLYEHDMVRVSSTDALVEVEGRNLPNLYKILGI